MAITLIDELQSGSAPQLVPITVDQFQQMILSGILKEGAPIELIDGLLVHKDRSAPGENFMGHNPRHALLILRLLRLLRTPSEASGWHVRVQLPVVLNNINAPEPDVAVVRGTEEDYAEDHPGPTDVALIIEVADSSLSTDRSTKRRLYATSGIAHYWIINLTQSQVEVYARPDPASGTYIQNTVFAENQLIPWSLSPTQQIEIKVSELFR